MRKQPKEMYFLSLIEMCQRFAFWGIGNLLVIYLVQHYQFSDKAATHLYGLFTGASFVLLLVGGYIADRTSYRGGVIVGSIATALGCFLTAIGSLNLLYAGLFFAAIGATIFTPSIYTILGRLYELQPDLREGGFSIYYAAVNIGVFLATFILGTLGHANLWSWAFIVAGMVQIFGLLVFLKVMRQPVFSKAHHHQKTSLEEEAPTKPLTRGEKKRVFVICVLSFISILFWMAYNQGWSSMSIFALNYTSRALDGFNLPASWLLSLESLYLVILAVPLATLYKILARYKKDPSPSMKTALSLCFMGLCFFLVRQGSHQIPSGAESAAVSPWYLIGAYALMAIAEMLIAPIGLSLVTHLSPRQYTGLLVGAWYLCIGVAFYLGGWIAGWMTTLGSLSSFFGIFVLLSWIPAVLLFFAAKKLTKMSQIKST